MKKVSIAFFMSICLFALSACSWINPFDAHNYIEKRLFITLPNEAAIEYEDSHGGFHGDGEFFAKVTFTDNEAKDFLNSIRQNEKWYSLPMEKDLSLLVFGGKDGDMTYGYRSDKMKPAQDIKNSVYFFRDRFAEQYKNDVSSGLLGRASYNYSIGVYDEDNRVLYVYERDT